MGYKKAMIHRMAEELNHIAYSNDPEKMEAEDLQTIIDAIFCMETNENLSDLASAAIGIYYCETGGVYDSSDELPEQIDLTIDAMAKSLDFDSTDDFLLDKLGIEQLKDEDGHYTGVYIKR